MPANCDHVTIELLERHRNSLLQNCGLRIHQIWISGLQYMGNTAGGKCALLIWMN